MTAMATRLGRWAALSLALLALAACGGKNVDQKFAFTPQTKDEALIVIGLKSFGIGGDITLTLSTFDPATKKPTSGPFSGYSTIEHKVQSREMSYYVARVVPGTHVIKSMNTQGYRTITIGCLNSGTMSFNIAAGQVLYLGNYQMMSAFPGMLGVRALAQGATPWTVSNALIKMPLDTPAAKAALATYGAIKADLTEATLTPTTFINGTNMVGDEVCGGYY